MTGLFETERRVTVESNNVEDIAQQIRRHVDQLNRLFVQAKKHDLQVELEVLGVNDLDVAEPDTNIHIVINKLRIEKNF